MLTNNYKIAVNSHLYHNNGSTFDMQNLTDINGTSEQKVSNKSVAISLDYGYGNFTLEQISEKEGRASIFVGTGQREESPEDIALESIIPDSDLIINSANVTFSKSKFFFTKTITYIGANDIIINEVAYYTTFKNTYSGTLYPTCLARQKIEPLTVKSGDTFTVTMVIG